MEENGMKGLVTGVLLLITTLTTGVAHAEVSRVYPANHSGWHTDVRQHHRVSVQKRKRQHARRVHRTKHERVSRASLTSSDGGIITVPTAAGIPIRVASKLADQFRGFIQDLIDEGYKPKQIGCWAPVGTHVWNSNHYHGGACDFDQTGWNRTDPKMYHVGALASKWGLRDGCSFRRPDCGHIDDGLNIGWKHPGSLIARYIDYLTTPIKNEAPKSSPQQFEE
jgi:hypothetical protein